MIFIKTLGTIACAVVPPARPTSPSASAFKSSYANLSYGVALVILPQVINTANELLSWRNEVFEGYFFWNAEYNRARKVLSNAELTLEQQSPINTSLSVLAAELTLEVQRVDILIKTLNAKLGHYKALAEREFRQACRPLKQEIRESAAVLSRFSKAFPGYKFWAALQDEIESASAITRMNPAKKGAIKSARNKISNLKARREELAATAQKIRAAEQKVLELCRSYNPLNSEEQVQIRMYAALTDIRSRLMSYHYQTAIESLFNGAFEAKLNSISSGKNSASQGPSLSSAYEILGISENADDTELKSAYRKESMVWHPDMNLAHNRTTAAEQKEAEEQFKAVNWAYETITNDRESHASPSTI